MKQSFGIPRNGIRVGGWLIPAVCALVIWLAPGEGAAGDLYIRFQMLEPAGTSYWVRLAGYIHSEPWYLPSATWPENADRLSAARMPSGSFTPWLDYGALAGKRLHRAQNRAGGVAEFPNLTMEFVTGDNNEVTLGRPRKKGAPRPAGVRRRVVVELATAPDPEKVVRRFQETFEGTITSVLISPALEKDGPLLETASEMTARRVRWAQEASGGKRVSPVRHILQTGFWSPQRAELNLKEAEVLWLLGFTVVGGMADEVREAYGFKSPGASHSVAFGPTASRATVTEVVTRQAKAIQNVSPGAPYNFADEVVSPGVGTNAAALAAFHGWLAARGVKPADLGLKEYGGALPIETPAVLLERQKQDRWSANRLFYYTARFRQASFTERLRWHTDAVRALTASNVLASTLVADHPYFGGTGLGMGMQPDTAWGSHALAADWFDIGRRGAVDLIGIEDWMGLQYMYGPRYTWEGFQLMGFQAAIFRSASEDRLPIIAWITPGNGTNTILKSASALCQGAKHFYYWTYGPTCTSTENYWSDSRGMYDGIVTVARQLAAAEQITVAGKLRPARVALLYSISSDLWQPFGYIHMLERRLTYLALIHAQLRVDFLSEEDVLAGRLTGYDVLYAADPCIHHDAAVAIGAWVKAGGTLVGSCAAGSRNQFDEPDDLLAGVFGIKPVADVTLQDGAYQVRGALNGIAYGDRVSGAGGAMLPAALQEIGAVGMRHAVVPAKKNSVMTGIFSDGSGAVISNRHGRGQTLYYGFTPALAYGKEANFVPKALAEQWPEAIRGMLVAPALARVAPPVAVSTPVVETGVYDAGEGTALVLANFTYVPIPRLAVALPVMEKPVSVRSSARGNAIAFNAEKTDGPFPWKVQFELPLDLMDIVVVENLTSLK